MNADAVLANYPPHFRAGSIRAVNATGGFSGARLWRISTVAGEFCLRCWPREHPSREHLLWIHSQLTHAAQRGVDFIPVPIVALDGTTVVDSQQHLWQLEKWLPGEANYHREPSVAKLSNCLYAVARFHVALTDPRVRSEERPSPGLGQRHSQLYALLGGGFSRLQNAVRRERWPAGFERALEILALFPSVAPEIAARLEMAARRPVPLQPCVRDLWHDHVLFTDDHLSGIIDFGAMRMECVAADLARLIGSLARDDDAGWAAALEAYSQIRPLAESEHALIAAFDQSSVLMSGMQWLQWIYLENRTFDDVPAVLRRLDENLARLQNLARRRFVLP